ncbi:MAG: linear amide C-N hydrolase [Deltaproteobacteria bacterium]|nr:linear amide C-N hydrolase [Deltaproteobacteria bacterium]
MKRNFNFFGTKLLQIAIILAVVTVFAVASDPAKACTRAMYVGADNMVITGRSMDWGEDMFSNAWVFPRGMARDGAAGPNSIKWTSKYGSLTVSGYEAGTADGMNEKGLVANVLFLAESDFGTPKGDKPILSISAWVQYVLDNFSSVAEVVDGLRAEPFQIIAPILPNGRKAQFHLSVSDPDGDSAIFEYIDGKLVIHHGKQYRVMTNTPNYDQQLAINSYWQGVDPMTFLPGSITSADRFARVSFLINAIPKQVEPHTIKAVPDATYKNQAVACVLGVMRAISVPIGVSHPTQPNLSSTLWRTVYNHKNKVFFFDSATSPNAFWVPLADLDFTQGAQVKKLTMAGGKVYAGNTASKFEPATPFKFLPAEIK